MSDSLGEISARAVLLDIEGTTTPIDFVYKVLFPYARDQVQEFLRVNFESPEVRRAITALVEQNTQDEASGLNPPPIDHHLNAQQISTLVTYVHWLMDADRKVTGLKTLQGLIWEAGYRTGALRGAVFDDVPRAFERWSGEGKSIAIFSSGSVLAQKLLFRNSNAGDLSRFIAAYFDTNIGGKMESQSYERIASAARMPPADMVFVSDIVEELDAAAAAGMQAVLSIRPGNKAQDLRNSYPAMTSFDQLFPSLA